MVGLDEKMKEKIVEALNALSIAPNTSESEKRYIKHLRETVEGNVCCLKHDTEREGV